MSDEEAGGPPTGGEGEKPVTDQAPAQENVAPEAAAQEAAAKAAAAQAKAEALAAKKAAKAAAEAAKPVWLRDPAGPEWQEADDDPLVQALASSHGDAVESARSFAGELTLAVRTEAIRDLCAALKGDHQFTYLVDICGVDYAEREPRFAVVYHLYSMTANRRIRLEVGVADGAEVPTVTAVWKAANWSEREVWDMYGVRFTDHPDMTRILTWEGFNGHPLRKDFPVEGIDTGAAIYPERYGEDAGPVAGTGTGWKPPAPPAAPEPTAPPPQGDKSD